MRIYCRFLKSDTLKANYLKARARPKPETQSPLKPEKFQPVPALLSRLRLVVKQAWAGALKPGPNFRPQAGILTSLKAA